MYDAQVSGRPSPPKKTVYYAGTDTLQEGYCLCYDVAADLAPTELRLARGTKVVKPATANLMACAGFVDAGSAGKVGPCFVEVNVPQRGEFINAFTNANMVAFDLGDGLAPQDGEYSLAIHTDAGYNVPLVALPAETANTSGTAANAKVMLLGG